MEKKWVLREANEETVSTLQDQLKIHPVLCRLLALRGIQTFDAAKQFFRTSPADLHDPFLMKDMLKAVERIHRAIAQNEKILVYGDYDVDGTTSVAVAYHFFRELTTQIEFYIPHRFSEGYGISAKGIQHAIAQGVNLIITLDCGIKSTALIREAKEHGIDTIVCDHHMPDDILPDAYAILNPKQEGCAYPYKELCGCGIGYKLISAYAAHYQVNQDRVDHFIDLVATAIAADIVPITGENRTLCVLGLEKANRDPSIPLKALRYINNLEKQFTINDLVFIIAPRVNAAGRMDDARKAVELFLEQDLEKAKALARVLHADNNDRRDIDKLTTEEALAQLGEEDLSLSLRSTVVYKPDWHKGVVGIVASRLIDHHYRPTIVLTRSGGHVTGSARSIKGFNLFEGLNQCAEYLENWGGHYFAAGLTLKEENLALFRQRFDAVVKEMLPSDMMQPVIEIDADLAFSEINDSFLRILQQFAPHGPDNMKPVFRSVGVRDHQGGSRVLKEKHLRLSVAQHHTVLNGIGFNLSDKLYLLHRPQGADILYHIEENTWNGHTAIQLKVMDIR